MCAELYSEVDRKSIKVCDCADQDRWRWRMILRGACTRGPIGRGRVTELKALVGNITPGDREDGVFWRWSKKGWFTVKSTYTFLIDGGLQDNLAFSIWKLRLPPKVKIFIWSVLRNHLLTTDNLLKRGWTGNSLCVFCGVVAETTYHLFTGCVYSRFVIGKGNGNAGFQSLQDSVRGEWERRLGGGCTTATNRTLSLLAANWWVLWKIRNRVVFRQANTDPLAAVHKVCEELTLWSELV